GNEPQRGDRAQHRPPLISQLAQRRAHEHPQTLVRRPDDHVACRFFAHRDTPCYVVAIYRRKEIGKSCNQALSTTLSRPACEQPKTLRAEWPTRPLGTSRQVRNSGAGCAPRTAAAMSSAVVRSLYAPTKRRTPPTIA